MGKKVLITGSTGFIGRHLIPKILKNGYEVLEITRSYSKSIECFGERTSKIEINDLLFKEKISEFDPEYVIHLAAYLTSSDEWKDIEKLVNSNILVLAKILNAVSVTNIKLFINTGSFSEYFYGNDTYEPAYFYAATKTASRSLVNYYSKAYNFKQVTVVPYTIYGGNDSNKKVIDIMIDSLNYKLPVDLSPGEQILDFIYIDDVIDFYLLLLERESLIDDKTNFQLGTGKGHTLREVAHLIEVISHKKVNINWGGKSYRNSDIMFAIANLKNSKSMLGWSPKITLEKGLEKLFVKIQ